MIIKNAIPYNEFDVLVTYEDGSMRLFHGERLQSIRSRYKILGQKEEFDKVQVSECRHTICWQGIVDIAPEWLWEWSEPFHAEQTA